MNKEKRKIHQKGISSYGKKASDYNIKKADGRWYAQIIHEGKKSYFYGKTQSEVRSKLKAKLFEIEQAKSAQLYQFQPDLGQRR